MRPKFGSPPCSAVLTSGESATRARDGLDDPVGALDDDTTNPRGTLAVAHDLERELAQ
jgi:hypothetical protein